MADILPGRHAGTIGTRLRNLNQYYVELVGQLRISNPHQAKDTRILALRRTNIEDKVTFGMPTAEEVAPAHEGEDEDEHADEENQDEEDGEDGEDGMDLEYEEGYTDMEI